MARSLRLYDTWRIIPREYLGWACGGVPEPPGPRGGPRGPVPRPAPMSRPAPLSLVLGGISENQENSRK